MDVSTGTISTVRGAGTASYGGDSGPATSATLNTPARISFDGFGNLYIADQPNNVIRMVSSATGNISTIAGDASAGYSGDGGPATAAQLNNAKGVMATPSGTIYIADQSNNAVRMIGPSGVLSFGSQRVGNTSPAETPVVANYGNAPLTFSSAPSVTGDFSIASGDTCGVSALAPGASCSQTRPETAAHSSSTVPGDQRAGKASPEHARDKVDLGRVQVKMVGDEGERAIDNSSVKPESRAQLRPQRNSAQIPSGGARDRCNGMEPH